MKHAHATPAILVLIVLSVIALTSTYGCRDKSNPYTPPDTTAPGQWQIRLSGPQVMLRGEIGGHVDNDTITVRVLDANGVPQANVAIHSSADVSIGTVTPTSQSFSDTVSFWWGASPAIIYWGDGGVDGYETVRSYIVHNGDTIRSIISFKVRDPIG